MKVRHVCEEPNKPIKHVYFMDEGITSVVAIGRNGKEIEIGIVGPEGMTGTTVVMGDHRSRMRHLFRSQEARSASPCNIFATPWTTAIRCSRCC